MGHCKGGPHMESNKQEKYNLMHDNPVAKHASGGSWMSKHSKSAFQMGHSPAEMGHDSPAEMHHPMNEEEKKFRKNVAKKTTDAAIDFITGPIGQIPGVKNKVQSLKNKKNRALGLGVDYKEAYVDADKKKYPTEASFTKAAQVYNNRKKK